MPARVGRVGEPPDNHEVPGPGRNHVADGLGVDASGDPHRPRRDRHSFADVTEPGPGPTGFGRCGVHRSSGDVIHW